MRFFLTLVEYDEDGEYIQTRHFHHGSKNAAVPSSREIQNFVCSFWARSPSSASASFAQFARLVAVQAEHNTGGGNLHITVNQLPCL